MGIIGSIRKHSWIAVAIVGIAIIAFILGDLTKNNQSIPDMGKVGNSVMTRQRFDDLVMQMENNYKMQQQTSQVPADVQNQIRDAVWQQFVDETLLEEQTSKLGLQVTPAEVSDMYTGQFIHPYMRQNFTNPQTGQYDYAYVNRIIENFDQLDTAARLQWVELEKTVKKDRQQQKYSGMITSGFYMPKAIAAKVNELGSQLANVRVAALPFHNVADDEVTLSDADYKAYYDEHRAEFRVMEEMRDLEFISFPVNPTPADLAAIEADVRKVWAEFDTIADAEIPFFVNGESHRSYDSSYVKASSFPSPLSDQIAASEAGAKFEPAIVGNEWMMAKVLDVANRPDSLRASAIYIFNDKVGGEITRGDEQAKLLADSVLNIVRSGAMTFEEAVNQYSDDPQKAENNGDMMWQLDGNYGFLNEDLVNTPEGGVFVVKHPNEVGYFVVKVTGKTTPHRKYRVATIARTIAASETTTRNIYNNANRFAGNNRTFAEMTATAQAENLQVRSSMINAMSYSMPGINNARSIVQWAYNEKTQVGDVADQIFEADDQYIVAALKDVYKVGYATLDQVRPSIENQVRIEKKAELLKARLEEAKGANANLTAIAAKMNVALDTLDSISFNDYFLGKYGMEPKVQAAIAAAEPNTLVGPIQGANGVYMVFVNSRSDNPAAPAADAIRSQRQQSFMQNLRNIQQVLKDHAKVVDQRNKFF